MSKDEYKAGKDKIAAEYKSAKAGCDSLSANAKDVCIAEAKGKQKVAKAELEAQQQAQRQDPPRGEHRQGGSHYAVAKESAATRPATTGRSA